MQRHHQGNNPHKSETWSRHLAGGVCWLALSVYTVYSHKKEELAVWGNIKGGRSAPTGRGIVQWLPPNLPGPRGMSLAPNMMACSDSSEMVQKGRLKSWWSMCGGMQSSCAHHSGVAQPHMHSHTPAFLGEYLKRLIGHPRRQVASLGLIQHHLLPVIHP